MPEITADFSIELTPEQIAECRSLFKTAVRTGGVIHTSIGNTEGKPKFYFKVLHKKLADELLAVIEEFYDEKKYLEGENDNAGNGKQSLDG